MGIILQSLLQRVQLFVIVGKWYHLFLITDVCNAWCKGEVFCGSGSILFVIASFMSPEFDIFKTSTAFSCIDSESSAQMPSRFDFSSIPSSMLILNRTHLKAAKIVDCVYNFLLGYSGTFIKNSNHSRVKICCRVCLHFALLVLVRYLIPWQLRLVTSQGRNSEFNGFQAGSLFLAPFFSWLHSPTSAAKILTEIKLSEPARRLHHKLVNYDWHWLNFRQPEQKSSQESWLCSDCQSFSQYHHKQSFSGLHSPRRS